MAAIYRPQARHALIVAVCTGLLLCLPAVPASAVPGQCAGKPATIVGTAGADTLVGTAGPDVIVGGDGYDTIRGRGGNDTICAGKGNDLVYADGGNDVIYLGWGHDHGEGGLGDDRVSGMNGRDYLWGDMGCHYQETCGGGDDHLLGGAKDDQLHTDPGNDILSQGGTLYDRSEMSVHRSGGPVHLDLRAGTVSSPYIGNDTLRGWHNIASSISISSAFDNVLHLDDGDTQLSSYSGTNTVHGYAGNDWIMAAGAVYAGAGDDRVQGGHGEDSLHGESGDDILRGLLGVDRLDGGEGEGDTCLTEPEDAVLACETQTRDPNPQHPSASLTWW